MNSNELNDNMTVLKVPTGFLGWGTPRYFKKDNVKILERGLNIGSGCCSPDTEVVFETSSGEILMGYEGKNVVCSTT